MCTLFFEPQRLLYIAYLQYLFNGNLGNVDEKDPVSSVGSHTDEFVRIEVQGDVIDPGIPEPQEYGGEGCPIPGEVRGSDHVVSEVEKGAEDSAERHLDQGHVFSGSA